MPMHNATSLAATGQVRMRMRLACLRRFWLSSVGCRTTLDTPMLTGDADLGTSPSQRIGRRQEVLKHGPARTYSLVIGSTVCVGVVAHRVALLNRVRRGTETGGSNRYLALHGDCP